MSSPESAAYGYAQLALESVNRSQRPAAERFWFLAAICACRAALLPAAAVCRERVLELNPQHALGHFPTVPDALSDPEFPLLVKRWERYCCVERAELLVANCRREWIADPDIAAQSLETLLNLPSA